MTILANTVTQTQTEIDGRTHRATEKKENRHEETQSASVGEFEFYLHTNINLEMVQKQ